MNVNFYGVRGSTPCCSPELHRYGGNTSCVVLEHPGQDPVVLDLGTGLRFYGLSEQVPRPFRGTALVSHLHWDHVQGLPFFAPVLAAGASLDIYAPAEAGPQGRRSAREAFDLFMGPPYFPVGLDALPGEIAIHDIPERTFSVGGWKVTALAVPHVGLTYGFRIEIDGRSVVYIPDHQQPGEDATEVAESVIELASGADLLIHDAQFDDAEFRSKSDWGHCTVSYAVRVAAEAQVSTLALFHHDPAHPDDQLDRLLAGAQSLGRRLGVSDVIAAAEGSVVSLSSTPVVNLKAAALASATA